MYVRLTRFAIIAFSLLLAISFLGVTFKKSLPEKEVLNPQVKGEARESQTPSPQGKSEKTIEFDVTGEGAWSCQADFYDCTSFEDQGEAQLLFGYCLNLQGDVHRLDADQDGQACEELL